MATKLISKIKNESYGFIDRTISKKNISKEHNKNTGHICSKLDLSKSFCGPDLENLGLARFYFGANTTI